jgi:hypothetical protein
MGCAGGARNPFDENITSASVGESPSESDGSTGRGSSTVSDSGATEPGNGDGSPCEVDADCEDGDVCTELVGCDPVSGCMLTPVSCDDDDPCTADMCDPVQGCVHEPVDCDDGDACTLDTCDPVQGCVHAPVDCDDGIECTQDSCDPGSGQCVHEPDHGACDDGDACTGMASCDAAMGCVMGTPVVCNDGDACTQDVCDPVSGQCNHPAVEVCASDDGCCPMGCSVQADNDCVCTNLAQTATPTSSGGGTNGTGYGPNNLNDGTSKAQCIASGCNQCFAWISNSSGSSGWFRLDWNSPVTIGSIYVEGSHVTNPSCGSSGRNLASGDVQWWNGNAWVTATSWISGVEDLSFDFNPPLQTTSIRLANVLSASSNSIAYEWYVYEPLGCTP